MTILSTANKTWYKVKLTYKSKSYTGYVYSSFIVIDKAKTKPTKATTKATTQATTQAPKSTSGYINENYVYFRKTAGGTPITYNGKSIMLMFGQNLTVTDKSDKTWYKVKAHIQEQELHRICILLLHNSRNLQDSWQR